MHPCISQHFAFAIILIFILDNAYSSSDTMHCSNSCTLHDSDINCWQGMENYLLNQLVDAVNNFSAVELMIERWRTKHGQERNVNETITDLLNRIAELNMNQGPLNSSYMDVIIDFTTQQVLSWVSLMKNSSDYDNFLSCPISSDYINTLWIYMFGCACIVLVLTLVYVIIHVRRLQGEVKKHKRLL